MFSVLRIRNRQVFRKNVPRMPCFSSVAAARTCCASASSKVSDTTVVAQMTVPAAQTLSPGLPALVQERCSEPSPGHEAEPPGGVVGGPLGGVVGGPLGGVAGGPAVVAGLLGGTSGFVPPQATSEHQTTTPIFRTASPSRTGAEIGHAASVRPLAERARQTCVRSGGGRDGSAGDGQRLQPFGADVRCPTVDGGRHQPLDLERVLVDDRLDLRLVLDA